MRILTNISEVDFNKTDGLVPAIIQDASTHKVLMLGYMNEESLSKTMQEGKVTFFSRSKGRLWTKGETSGNFLLSQQILLDCDQDTILIKVNPVGPACHTGADTCFDEENVPSNAAFIQQLANIIKARKSDTSGKSYTKSLFDSGIAKMAQKVGEEAVEVVIEAMRDNKELFKEEASDLLFHYLVLIEGMNLSLEEIVEVLAKRHQK
ncbi:bifunctional phosphoribosyl-AMP cyclohydrolase/phosphoribosyl-ATP diphosphatase HisIE [Fulvivirgaceae bacterium LMO-SS25]